MTVHAPPPTLVAELRRLTASELSPLARAGYVGLLLAAAIMTAIVTALLLTEPSLPRRTAIALGLLAGMGSCWVLFAAWVLMRRRVLLGAHRVIAGRLAVACSTVFVLGAVLVGYATSSTAALAAAGLGGVMLVAALWIWIRARRVYRHLSGRRAALEAELGRARAQGSGR